MEKIPFIMARKHPFYDEFSKHQVDIFLHWIEHGMEGENQGIIQQRFRQKHFNNFYAQLLVKI